MRVTTRVMHAGGQSLSEGKTIALGTQQTNKKLLLLASIYFWTMEL